MCFHKVLFSVAFAVCVAPARNVAQEPVRTDSSGAARAADSSTAQVQQPTSALRVKPVYPTDGWVDSDDRILLELSEPVRPEAGRLAVIIGQTDATPLFTMTQTSVRYGPTTLLLPAGESQLTVYLVAPDNKWTQLGEFPLRVRNRAGFHKAELKPGLTLSTTSQLARERDEGAPNPLRTPYPGVTFNPALRTTFVRQSGTIELQTNLLGVTHQDKALRFGDRGDRAPKLDLSDYLIRTQHGPLSGSIGHVSFGAQRHLVNSFASRGVSAGLRLARFADIAFAAMNGTSIVGWVNPLGLQEPDHRIYSATLGLDAIPRRPGSLRLETSLLRGSLLPITGVNEGEINDAEESRGWGLRLVGKVANERVRLEAGYARSRFHNPNDPTLTPALGIVAVRPETRGARYLDLTMDVIRELAFTPSFKGNLAATYRHERVDPLYRSLAASIQANALQHIFELNGALGPIALQASHARSEDNLDNLANVLKTLTRATALNVGVPLGTLFRPSAPLSFMPQFAYTLSRTHQFGDALPVNSDFTETHVPDQMSTNQSFDVQWQQNKWRAGYRYNVSGQDNRQVGRENADLDNLAHNIAAGVSPFTWMDIGATLSFEGADNKELDQTNSTRRVAFNVDFRPTADWNLASALSTTWMFDDPRTTERDDTEFTVELSRNFRLLRPTAERPGGRLFLRYLRQAGSANQFLDGVAGVPLARRDWALNSGVSLNAF